MLTTLAAAYAGSGRFEAAIASAEKALALARVAGAVGQVKALREHLARYRRQAPLRD